METIPFAFCSQQQDYEKAKAVILQVPYDSTAFFNPGSRNGPHEIIRISKELEFYDHELDLYPTDLGIHTKGELIVFRTPGKMVDTVKNAVSEVLADNKIPVMLGGEHGVTAGAVQAAAEKHPEMSVLHLDAHADLDDSYEGTKFHQACVARRCFESCPSIVQVGVRNITEEAKKFARENNIQIHYAPNYDVPKIISQLNDDVYITIDTDVLDPSIMPATCAPEPGGMSWYELISLLENVIKSRKVVGFDIMEHTPIPNNVAPTFTCAKILQKIFGLILKYGERTKNVTQHGM